MNATLLNAGTLAGQMIGAQGMRGLVVRLVLVVVSAGLLTIAAKIKVPFYPVPMTLQTLAVVMIGATLGARLGAAAILLYVCEGLVGLPVFTNTPPQIAGPAYVMGPTGGYLLGFLFVVMIVGFAARRGLDRSIVQFAFVLLAAETVLFACGVAWLVGSLGISLARAYEVGVLPFLPGEAVKMTLAALLMPAMWQMMAWLKKNRSV